MWRHKCLSLIQQKCFVAAAQIASATTAIASVWISINAAVVCKISALPTRRFGFLSIKKFIYLSLIHQMYMTQSWHWYLTSWHLPQLLLLLHPFSGMAHNWKNTLALQQQYRRPSQSQLKIYRSWQKHYWNPLVSAYVPARLSWRSSPQQPDPCQAYQEVSHPFPEHL